jgi:RimJ/RimL family protein N-acetyltransferase
MKFKKDLNNYIVKETPTYIKEVDINTINFEDLSEEIKVFNLEINWKDMWDVEEVKNRLSNGWRFLVFIPNDKIKGWYWLDNTNEPRNLYINKEYRNKGFGREMQIEMLNICKKLNMSEVNGYIDDWNTISIKCIKNAGWCEISD